jgi:cation transport ATPase
MPDGKVTAIKGMGRTGGVITVGHGINDALALAAASADVADGSGTDVALEAATADPLRNRVTDLAAMIRLARATMGNRPARLSPAFAPLRARVIAPSFPITRQIASRTHPKRRFAAVCDRPSSC